MVGLPLHGLLVSVDVPLVVLLIELHISEPLLGNHLLNSQLVLALHELGHLLILERLEARVLSDELSLQVAVLLLHHLSHGRLLLHHHWLQAGLVSGLEAVDTVWVRTQDDMVVVRHPFHGLLPTEDMTRR